MTTKKGMPRVNQEDLSQFSKLKLLGMQDESQREYWKLEENYRKLFQKKKEILAEISSLAQRKSDIASRILNMMNEYRNK